MRLVLGLAVFITIFSLFFLQSPAYACQTTGYTERLPLNCYEFTCASTSRTTWTGDVKYTYPNESTCTQSEWFTDDTCTVNRTNFSCPMTCTSDISGGSCGQGPDCVAGALCLNSGLNADAYCADQTNTTYCSASTLWCQAISCVAPTATPTPTPTPTPTATPIPTATPTLPPGVTPTATPVPTATPTTAPSCTCLSGAGSCATNSRNADLSMPASAWPAGCPIPACSGGWDYHSEDDVVCQNNFGAGYYCWQCSVLPTATPVPSGVPTATPTPTTPSCNRSASCSSKANIENCRPILCDATGTCIGDCNYLDTSGNNQTFTVRTQTQITECEAPVPTGYGGTVSNPRWSPAWTSVCSGPAPTAATYTISGLVFIDRNDNDRREADGLDNIAGTIDDETLYSGARLFLNTQTTTTDTNGAYQFTSVTSGSYPLELDVPFGFSPNKSTGYSATTDTNKVTRSVGPNATADFGIVPYEVGIGGTMYTTLNDTCSAGITNVGRLGTQSLSLSESYFDLNWRRSSDGTGKYSFSYPYSDTEPILIPSSSDTSNDYSITPDNITGKRLVCAIVDAGSASATAVSVRSTPFSYDFSLTKESPQKRIDFYYQLVQPWFQGRGADMRIDSGFNDPVSASSRNPYAMLSNSRSTGVIFSGGNSYSFCVVASAGTCLNRASELTNPWVVGGTIYPETFTSAITGTARTSYGYLLGLVRQNGQTINEITNSDCYSESRGCNLAALDPGIYTNQTGQNNVYTRSSKSQFNRGDYVFLINGNLHIQGELELVNTPNDAVLVVSVSGDITVDKDVGGSPSSSSTHLEGLFSADSDFILESEGTDGDNCPSNRDKRLNIEGAIVANALLTGATFQNNRTLCNDNSDYPTIYFEESPYLILNAPDFLKHKSFVWQEVAP